MGTDFLDGFQGLAGQRHQVLMDGDMHLADDLVTAGMDQFQIPDKPPGERILNGDDDGVDIRRIVGCQHFFKTVKALQLQRNILIEGQGGFLVETAPTSQNRNFFHGPAQKMGYPFPDSPTIYFNLCLDDTASGYYLF